MGVLLRKGDAPVCQQARSTMGSGSKIKALRKPTGSAARMTTSIFAIAGATIVEPHAGREGVRAAKLTRKCGARRTHACALEDADESFELQPVN